MNDSQEMTGVIFGISGSIAAFKALEVIRLLVADGIDIYPVLSPGGQEFVTRCSVEALTGKPAVTELFPASGQQEIEHIALSESADLMVTCPASADIIAKYACGIADDPLSLVALTFGQPHLIAPAMNHRMWENPATVKNVETLTERGFVFMGPDKGMMACGEEGWGRLTSIEEIYGTIRKELAKNGPLAGRRILVSAGGTREYLDEVRYITNRSTGRMGHAIAEVARDLGAAVDLVTASDLPAPSGVNTEKVTSAEEMKSVIMNAADFADVVIMTAAVADLTPAEPVKGKIKKSDFDETMAIPVKRTTDILRELGERKRDGQKLVGFAAEWGPDARDEALRKCREKSCDLICLNDISRKDIGFSSEYNEITMVLPDGTSEELARGGKKEIARSILDRLISMVKDEEKSICDYVECDDE